MTQRGVERYGARWQARLALQDWQITWEAVPANAITAGGCTGDVHWDLQAMMASVRIAAQRPAPLVLTTIRHELLHLVLADAYTHAQNAFARLDSAAARGMAEDALDSAHERAILQIERALKKLIAHGD